MISNAFLVDCLGFFIAAMIILAYDFYCSLKEKKINKWTADLILEIEQKFKTIMNNNISFIVMQRLIGENDMTCKIEMDMHYIWSTNLRIQVAYKVVEILKVKGYSVYLHGVSRDDSILIFCFQI